MHKTTLLFMCPWSTVLKYLTEYYLIYCSSFLKCQLTINYLLINYCLTLTHVSQCIDLGLRRFYQLIGVLSEQCHLVSVQIMTDLLRNLSCSQKVS